VEVVEEAAAAAAKKEYEGGMKRREERGIRGSKERRSNTAPVFGTVPS
jgi:hypothetical protein